MSVRPRGLTGGARRGADAVPEVGVLPGDSGQWGGQGGDQPAGAAPGRRRKETEAGKGRETETERPGKMT